MVVIILVILREITDRSLCVDSLPQINCDWESGWVCRVDPVKCSVSATTSPSSPSNFLHRSLALATNGSASEDGSVRRLVLIRVWTLDTDSLSTKCRLLVILPANRAEASTGQTFLGRAGIRQTRSRSPGLARSVDGSDLEPTSHAVRWFVPLLAPRSAPAFQQPKLVIPLPAIVQRSLRSRKEKNKYKLHMANPSGESLLIIFRKAS